MDKQEKAIVDAYVQVAGVDEVAAERVCRQYRQSIGAWWMLGKSPAWIAAKIKSYEVEGE